MVVHASFVDRVPELPHGSIGSQQWNLCSVPLDLHERMEIHTSGIRIHLHHMPHPPIGSQQRRVRLVPHHRCELGVQSPELIIVRIVPQRTFEPLRFHLCIVPLSVELLGQRHVQSPPGSGRRTLVSKLLLHFVPSKRIHDLRVHFLPRGGRRR
jgi:hypothetical protein